MPVSANAVANEFLDLAKEAGGSLTPMKIQKLVYFAQGWKLGLTDVPMFEEEIMAWRWGPVTYSVYLEFRSFGNEPITRHAIDVQDDLAVYQPSLREAREPGEADRLKGFIDKVWAVYGLYTAIQLSKLTHQEGTPWAQVAAKFSGDLPMGVHIPKNLIRDYFKKQAENE